METLKNHLPKILLIILFQFVGTSAFAFEAWWQCDDRRSGDWTFGRAPYVCLVDHMQTQSTIKNQYEPLLFDDNLTRSVERSRYMTELNALAKQVANYYLKKRKPAVSAAELAAFTKGLLTLMHQETVWTHYRVSSDHQARYMRGDSGHGHGLMQVDDRSHQTALLEGRGADLIRNMMYGLDVFYDAWQDAPNTSCVRGETDYTNRIRSAWSAYNGGPSRICRWADSSSSFAHHDTQFLQKLNNQSFKNYVNDDNMDTSLNVECLVEGTRPCANTGNNPIMIEPMDGELYMAGSLYCLWGDDLKCVDRLNDVNCLAAANGRSYQVQGVLNDEQVAKKNVVQLDRNSLCLQGVTGMYSISQVIDLQKRINIRKTPGGEWLATAPLNFTTKILDFEVTSESDQERYYKINYEGAEGYVYAGDKSDYADWAKAIDDSEALHPYMANIGESVKIVSSAGINMRSTPGGSLIMLIPNSEILGVLDRVIQGSKNYLYYKVSYKDKTGYIYSGYLDNEESIATWTEVQRSVSGLALLSSLDFQYLKECPAAECDFNASVLKSQNSGDIVQVTARDGEWVEVTSADNKKSGWILESLLEEVN